MKVYVVVFGEMESYVDAAYSTAEAAMAAHSDVIFKRISDTTWFYSGPNASDSITVDAYEVLT